MDIKTKLPTPQKLPSGQYRCQVMVDGKRISVVDEKPDVVQAKAIAFKTGLKEAAKEERNGSLTLSAAMDKYIDERRNVLSPSTIRSYKDTQKNRIQGLLKRRVNKICESDLQLAINEEVAYGRSAKTIKNDISLAISVLSAYKLINMKKLKFPQRIRHEHVYLDTEQIVTLINACIGDKAEIPILMALWLGMRRSEILGLYWESVNFDNQTITIENSCVRNEDQKYIIKNFPKNEGSRRNISCPGYILSKLAAMMPTDQRTGRIFQTGDTSFIYDRLKIICDREKIPFPGVHGLRHTNASVMLSLGVIDKVAMARGGWSTDYTMKTIYQHLFQADRKSADQKINDYFASMILHTNLHIESK